MFHDVLDFVTTYLDILLSEFLLFVVEEAVVDDHRQISRDLGAGRVVTRAVTPGVLAAAGGCLGDDEDLTQHPVVKFIIRVVRPVYTNVTGTGVCVCGGGGMCTCMHAFVCQYAW